MPARLLGARWWGFEPWHLWYFSRESLVLTLERQGFEVIERRSYRRTFSLGYWLAKGEGLVGRTLARGLSRLAGAMRLEGVKLTLDLRDTHEVLARKR